MSGLEHYLDGLPLDELVELSEFVSDLDGAGLRLWTADGRPLAPLLGDYTSIAVIESAELGGTAPVAI